MNQPQIALMHRVKVMKETKKRTLMNVSMTSNLDV